MMTLFYRLFLLLLLNLPQAMLADTALSKRPILVTNQSNLSFDVQPKPFDGSYFTPFAYTLFPQSQLSFSLESYNDLSAANGVVVFMLGGRYVFSLVIKDQMISVHGCKSKNVFFHPDDYVCQLKDGSDGIKELLIMRPSDA